MNDLNSLEDIKTCNTKVANEIYRLENIQNELDILLEYCNKLNNIGNVAINKTNYPHQNQRHGEISFNIIVRTRTLDNEITELVKEQFLDDAQITWVEEQKHWLLTATYKNKT